MPPHSVYVEPFFGSGQVFHRKRKAANSVLIDRNPEVLRLLPDDEEQSGVEVIMGDALDWLPALNDRIVVNHSGERIGKFLDNAVIYCDPPYVLSTRKERLYYEHEMSDADHSALLSTLKALKCRVLLSGYDCALYSSQLQDWRCIRYRTRTRGKTVTECLWCNFPEPEELHDWRYAGHNFRQRTALSRLKRRWLGKLERMKPRQRGYVLNAIEETYFRAAG